MCLCHTHTLSLSLARSLSLRLANQFLLLLVAGLCRRTEGVRQRVCPTSMETCLLQPHPSAALGIGQPVLVCRLEKVPRQKSTSASPTSASPTVLWSHLRHNLSEVQFPHRSMGKGLLDRVPYKVAPGYFRKWGCTMQMRGHAGHG